MTLLRRIFREPGTEMRGNFIPLPTPHIPHIKLPSWLLHSDVSNLRETSSRSGHWILVIVKQGVHSHKNRECMRLLHLLLHSFTWLKFSLELQLKKLLKVYIPSNYKRWKTFEVTVHVIVHKVFIFKNLPFFQNFC
jgi:hypothetical protein